MIGFVFEVVSELIPFGFVPLFLTVATVWVVWHVFEKIDPNEVKNIQSFVTFIVVVVPFAMLFYGGLTILVYDQMMTASGSWRAVFLPLSESPWVILAGAVVYIGLTVWLWSHWRKLAIRHEAEQPPISSAYYFSVWDYA